MALFCCVCLWSYVVPCLSIFVHTFPVTSYATRSIVILGRFYLLIHQNFSLPTTLVVSTDRDLFVVGTMLMSVFNFNPQISITKTLKLKHQINVFYFVKGSSYKMCSIILFLHHLLSFTILGFKSFDLSPIHSSWSC